MRTFEVGAAGTSLFVYEWGSKNRRTVLYWDGLGRCGLHANEVAPILAEEYGLRLIAPDPPGHGRSPGLAREAYRPSALADLAAGLLSSLGVERAGFVGFSWGADVACAFAARHPERTTALVLIDGGYIERADVTSGPAPDLVTLIEEAGEELREERVADWHSYFRAQEAAVKRWTPALAEAHRATMREERGGIVPVVSPEVVGAIRHADFSEPTLSTHASLRAASIPVLLLTPSEESKFGELAEHGIARFRAAVPQLRVEHLPGDVHDLVSYAPRTVAALVGSWVSGDSP
jgi:pimeloyl-ACP methyl ester carboxylesterase